MLGRKELSKGTKLRVVNVMVIPTLTYGCEAWALQVRHKGRIQIAVLFSCTVVYSQCVSTVFTCIWSTHTSVVLFTHNWFCSPLL